MKGSEDIHKLTEAIYKNLVDNFNGGIRQVLLTGKAYHKALHGVSVTANAYNDALNRLGSAAKICRGGTDEIGEAILQIAEAQKELQIHIEESSKVIFTELLLPLEQKLEKEFKKANHDAKRYSQGHKVVQSPYNKAFDHLKKFRKKTKNKYMYDNEKEAQLVRTLDRCQAKLEEYRVESVRKAMLEERRCYCFVLQRLCAISQTNFVTHRHGLDLYSALPLWREVCSNPHALPPAADQLIAEHFDGEFEPMNGGPTYHDHSFLHREVKSLQRSKSIQDVNRKPSAGYMDGSRTLPHRALANGAVPGLQSHNQQVEAIYSFNASVDNQLSFNTGDIITLLGDKSDGWQYGQNVETQRMGWFPLSFTQPVRNSRASPELRLSPGYSRPVYFSGPHIISSYNPMYTKPWHEPLANPWINPLTTFSYDDEYAMQRAKSIGDLLDSRSLAEQKYFDEHDVPGNVRRPRSLYEPPPPSLRPSQTAPQAVRHGIPPIHPFHHPVPLHPQYSVPKPCTEPDPLYQPLSLPTDNMQQLHTQYTRRDQSPQHTASNYSAYGRPVQDIHQGSTPIRAPQPSPPLAPPPPPPPPIPQPDTLATQSPSTTTTTYTHSRSYTLPARTSSVRRVKPHTEPPQAPPPPTPSGSASQPPSGPAPAPPPPPPISGLGTPALTSTTNTKHLSNILTSMSLLSQQSTKSSPGYRGGLDSPIRQQSSVPPPPIPNNTEQDNSYEEEVNYRDNPMFSSVSLRKTKTNDRSAPKIK